MTPVRIESGVHFGAGSGVVGVEVLATGAAFVLTVE